MSATRLVWRWATAANPDAPARTQTPGGCRAARIAHPLADRVGQACTLIAQSPTNGNRLVEFDDGHRVIAPLYATRAPRTTEEKATCRR